MRAGGLLERAIHAHMEAMLSSMCHCNQTLEGTEGVMLSRSNGSTGYILGMYWRSVSSLLFSQISRLTRSDHIPAINVMNTQVGIAASKHKTGTNTLFAEPFVRDDTTTTPRLLSLPVL